MQQELEADYPDLDIQILGVNEAGKEAGNSSISDGRDIPWLQDTSDADVWNAWAVTYRDVIILDQDNRVYDVFNVTTYDLSDTSSYEALKQIFIDAASE